ncbi:MAG: hypothetical protein OHK0031_13180 [Anaerolineales bacterium]
MTNQIPAPAVLSPLSPSEERTWAMLAHLSVLVNLFTGFLGPVAALVIYLLFKDRSRYVAYHSLQAFINQLVWWVGGGTIIGITWAVTGALTLALVGLLLIPLACLVSLMPMISVVQGVWGAVKTSSGEDFRYWWVGGWTRGTLEG